MSVVKKNIVANIAGTGATALLSIMFIPVYIHFMGIESYGLVGFYVTLQVLFSLLDLGLTSTVSRELARLSGKADPGQEMRNMVRTLEIVYWGIAIIVLIIAMLLAPWVAEDWLNKTSLTSETVQKSIVLMGIVIAFRMPYGFYSGGLLGLQKQVLLNLIKVAIEVARSGGVVLVLWLLSPTIVAFFQWQIVISAIGACLMFFSLWRCLPSSHAKPVFQLRVFRTLWRFMAGISGIAILSIILIETDKIILSKILSLKQFAYYILASTVAMGLHVIIVPVFSAIYPRLSQLVASEDGSALRQLYHKSCQFMTVLVIPIALVISFYSETLLQAWIQDPLVSRHSAEILSILIIGTALNGMMNIPYALQLAHGWTKLSIISNIIAIAVLIPTLLVVVPRYGAVGAAAVWVMLNTGYVLFNLPIVHAKLLRGELKQWIIRDFGIPSLATAVVVVFSWVMIPDGMSVANNLIWIFVTLVIALSASILSAPIIRLNVFEIISKYRLTA